MTTTAMGVRRPARRGCSRARARRLARVGPVSALGFASRDEFAAARCARCVLVPSGRRASFPVSVSATMVLTCVVCRSQAFDETDEGFFVCLRCGTQSQDVVREVEDEEKIDKKRKKK